jgi:3-isopropylmalate/(R)-2-methylmalate dehydratase small subunit
MYDNLGGPVTVLDRDDINSMRLFRRAHLTENNETRSETLFLEDLKLAGFDPKGDTTKQARVIVTRANFGCGSSREHAPWVLEVNGITVVVAESFARIFRQNMFNCGMAAIELPKPAIDTLFSFRGARYRRLLGPCGTDAYYQGGRQEESFS